MWTKKLAEASDRTYGSRRMVEGLRALGYPVSCRRFRPHCHPRHRLGELCRIVGRLLAAAYREVDSSGKPGFVLFVQTLWDLVTFHPHIHALVADGVFQPNGVFRVLPLIPARLLEEQLRRAAGPGVIEVTQLAKGLRRACESQDS